MIPIYDVVEFKKKSMCVQKRYKSEFDNSNVAEAY